LGAVSVGIIIASDIYEAQEIKKFGRQVLSLLGKTDKIDYEEK
jgi:hypothetical protein